MNEISCTCQMCVSACKRMPGWMLPAEARRAIESGHARRLMLDWYTVQLGDRPRHVYLLCPACVGHEGRRAPSYDEMFPPGSTAGFFATLTKGASPAIKGRCVYLTEDNRCEIHTSGFKPFCCRDALLCDRARRPTTPQHMAVIWDRSEGKQVVQIWQKLVGFDMATLAECDMHTAVL